MLCAKCGHLNSDGSVFCSSCGVSQTNGNEPNSAGQGDPTDLPTTATPKKKFFSTKRLIAVGAAVVLVTTTVLVFMPKSVTVEIGIVAPNGGVFDASCNVQADAADQTPSSIDLSVKQDGSSPISASVSYSLNASGLCVGKAKASLSPFSTYYAFNNGTQIAEITPSDIGAGKVSIGTSVTIVRDLRVNFNLYDKADSCTGSTESWNCWWDNDYIFGLKLNSKTGKCSGQNGFSDIHKGTSVTVKGRSNNQIATEYLVVDTYELVSVGSKQIVCKFYADFSGIANDDLGYSITSSNRGSVDYDLGQIRDNSWVADMQLNQ